jgi:hypothetical protein
MMNGYNCCTSIGDLALQGTNNEIKDLFAYVKHCVKGMGIEGEALIRLRFRPMACETL